jgi:two-component system phosphate regulon sensor histidine kinase PhoR
LQRRIYLNFFGLLFLTGTAAGILTGDWLIIVPLTAAASVAALFLVKRLTKKILRPFEPDAGNGYIHDELIPYLKRAADRQRETERQIETLKHRAAIIEAVTHSMKEGLIMLDASGHILIANNSAYTIFNRDISRENILYICRDTGFQRSVRICLEEGRYCETRLSRGGRLYSVFFDPVRSGGEVNGAAVLFLDISDSVRAEKQRREFSANVSHELKTPLTAISGLAEMIAGGIARSEDIPGFSERIYQQARRLIDIIEDIIRLSELDENGKRADFTEFDLRELALTVADNLKEKAREKNVVINVGDGEALITSDRRLIETLLFNLADNAVKYNKDGGTVTVTMLGGKNGWQLAVADTGIGIPPSEQQRVFERFSRVDKSRSKKTGGTGLGLSIVKHIMEHVGGRVKIESEEGEGTTVICGVYAHK